MPSLARRFFCIPSTRNLFLLSLLSAAALSLALVALPPGARAATVWHVSPITLGACTQADPNCKTIQAAVNAASAGDTIRVDAGTYKENISINKDLTVNGAGAGPTVVQTVVDGNHADRVFIISNGTVTLSGMIFTNGITGTNGGGIKNLGTLTVINCTVSNNTSAGGDGGAIFNSGTLNLTNSTVSSNTASVQGGGISNEGTMTLTGSTVSNNSANGSTSLGGGIHNLATLNVTNSAVSDNFAGGNGGGIYNGGMGTTTVTNSTISGNSAQFGGGIYNFNDTANVTDSTISNNTARIGGGIFNSGAGGHLAVTSSTVSGNSATANNTDSGGGGILNQVGGMASVRSSIVAGNTAFCCTPDLSGHFTSQGHNLVGATNGINGFSNGRNNDIVGTLSAPVDAKLAPLGFYGPPTQTQLPLCGSPAIDAGDDTVTDAPLNLTTDQRGAARMSGAHVDIGSVERQQGVQINSQDSGPGSLRQLIADAADGAVIDLDCAAVTVTLTSDELRINKNLTINGPGSSLMTVQRSAAQGTPQFRIFEMPVDNIHFTDFKTVNLSGMTISNGHAPDGPTGNFGVEGGCEAGKGGGILNSGMLALSDVVVSGNVSGKGCNNTGHDNSGLGFPGGGGGWGGGVFNGGPALTLTNCTVSGNATGDGGTGSPSGGPGGPGGGIYSSGGSLTLTNTTVSGNITGVSGGDDFGGLSSSGAGGGVYVTSGTITINESTIAANSTGIPPGANPAGNSGAGGGIYYNGADGGSMTLTKTTVSGNSTGIPGQNTRDMFSFTGSGGGIFNHAGTLNVTDCTVSNNSVSGTNGHGGGIFNNGGTLTLTSSTVSGNSTVVGGGIFRNGGTVNVRSSIVAGNTASSNGPDLNGAFTSQGHNLVGIGDGSTGFTNGTSGDIVGTASAPVDAMLQPLGNYGGPTQTQLPRLNSPVIDAGDDVVLNPPLNLATDQRGVARKIGSHVDIGSVEFNAVTDAPGGAFQFSVSVYAAPEGNGFIVVTVTRTGQLTQAASVDFATADNDPNHLLPCSQVSGNASSRCDYEATSGTLQFAPGDSSKSFTVLINDDFFVEGTETAKLILSNPTGGSALGQQSTATLEIDDNDTTPPTTNPIDNAEFFVRQHYHDFLNREADQSGLNFWTGGITSCGSDARCVAVKRVNTSAAFFLSIEFQNTGYYVYRVYKTAFGDINPPQVPVPVRFDNFLRDTQTVEQGVIVGQGNWQQQLAANKSAYALDFVHRADFLARYPFSMSAGAFVNDLDANAGGVLTDEQKTELMGELAPTNEHPPGPSDFALRADVLQKVAENAVLQQREFNRAFVLMQYFGYLRRNPDDAPDADFSGYDFWLGKLNQFNGDFVKAEMVRAFIESAEYRHRFGP